MIGVCIVTYNEEKYIAECIDSALMQKCTEPMRVYVANDCSTDRTADVCRKYGNQIVFVDREKNLGLVGNTMALLEQIRKDGCEYVAMLDGDDYWCDTLKLQKQIDYMHAHPEYGLVHTCIDLLYPSGLEPDNRISVKEGDVNAIISEYVIGNCSVLFRTELLNHINFDEFLHQGFMSVDYVMYCIFSMHTQIGFLPDHTAVWRRGHSSVSNNHDIDKQINYCQNGIAMWKYLSKLFPERWPYTEEGGNAYAHTFGFNTAFRLGDRKRALSEAAQLSPANRKKLGLKWCVAHSRILTAIWRKTRNMDRH